MPDDVSSYLRTQDPGHFDATLESAAGLAGDVQKTNPASLESDDVRWNFTKFLVGKNGEVIRRYESYVTPQEIRSDVEPLLRL